MEVDFMPKYMTSTEDVKKALKINSFCDLSKDKIMEFVSAIPNMDKDVAIKIIEQFPTYAEAATTMLTQLNTMCDNVLRENGASQKEAIEAYKKILDDLGEILKKDDISPEERTAITDRMVTIADKISLKDTENKEFLSNVIKYGSSIVGGALILGAIILGVKGKGTKIPTLNNRAP
jgi:predicted unusual protein kinase regulating ubiquinone biosynthesis (AarF/ABC1/UbiB family)